MAKYTFYTTSDEALWTIMRVAQKHGVTVDLDERRSHIEEVPKVRSPGFFGRKVSAAKGSLRPNSQGEPSVATQILWILREVAKPVSTHDLNVSMRDATDHNVRQVLRRATTDVGHVKSTGDNMWQITQVGLKALEDFDGEFTEIAETWASEIKTKATRILEAEDEDA